MCIYYAHIFTLKRRARRNYKNINYNFRINPICTVHTLFSLNGIHIGCLCCKRPNMMPLLKEKKKIRSYARKLFDNDHNKQAHSTEKSFPVHILNGIFNQCNSNIKLF